MISWNEARIETPIIDIITLYHNIWEKTEFSQLLKRYIEKCSLSDEELKLLLINISIPLEINEYSNEIDRTIEMSKFVDYIYKTEDLIRPYYSK